MSLGTIAFASACLTAAVSALIIVLLLRRRGPELRLGAMDLALFACLALCWASFLLSPRVRGPVFGPFLLVAGLAAYLLVRVAGRRTLEPRGALLASLVVILAAAEAAQGLLQRLSGAEMKGFFYNTNHLAMFLALALPPALALARVGRHRIGRGAAAFAAGFFLLGIVLTGCRSALVAAVLAVGFMAAAWLRNRGKLRWMWAGPAAGVAAVTLVIVLALAFKPLSTVGRVLIWKVSAGMFLTHPLAGTGYASFPGLYNVAQEGYFGRGAGTAAERLSASPGAYAFNDYIEIAVELGILGLLVFGALGFVVLRAIGRVLGRPGPNDEARAFVLAAAASIMAYAVISLFYYPSRILPVFLLFGILLAWVVNSAEEPAGAGREAKGRGAEHITRRVSRARAFVLGFSGAALVLSLSLLPSFARDFAAERAWSSAQALSRDGQDAAALAICDRIAPRFWSKPQFLVFYSRRLAAAGRSNEAISRLKSAGPAASDPLVLEELALALERKGEHDAARACALRVSRMLPWRLTAKVLVARIDDRTGDDRECAEFALAALDTPLKLRTAEGIGLKREALDLWLKHDRGAGAGGHPLLDEALKLPDAFRADALAALESAGANAPELIAAISLVDPAQRAGLGFLLANMPDADLRTLSARFLAEQVRLAYSVRGKLPFVADVPDDVFLNDVLPYAVVNERRDDWRKEFLARFGPVAARSASLEDAAIDLNLSILAQFKLTYRERDDRRRILGPFETVKRGALSCGEGSVLLVDACRAVGIPARLVLVGHWAGMSLGHEWVEVYDRGRWRRLTAYDPCRFDQDWMESLYHNLDPADPRQHVLASSFKRTDVHGAMGPDVSFVDVTNAYRQR